MPISVIASIAALSPSWASSVISGPSSASPRAPAPGRGPDWGCSPAIRVASRVSAVPEASDSTQPRPGQLPWQRRPVLVDHHVPELGRRAERAAVELAAEDQAAADPGADRQHDGLARRPGPRRRGARRGPRGWRRCRRTPAARAARPSLARTAMSAQRQVDRHHPCPVRSSIRHGIPKPTASISSARGVLDLAHDLRRGVRAVRPGSSPATPRCARWWTPKSSSTSPASSFVPPMSTPMRAPTRHAVTICSGPWPRNRAIGGHPRTGPTACTSGDGWRVRRIDRTPVHDVPLAPRRVSARRLRGEEDTGLEASAPRRQRRPPANRRRRTGRQVGIAERLGAGSGAWPSTC